MKNTSLNRFFVPLLIITIFIFSCSSDDDNNDNNNAGNTSSNAFVELPESDLGVYDGVLLSGTITNGDTSVTLSESGDKSYDIDFSDDIPSITNVQFIAVPNSVSNPTVNNVFTTGEEELNRSGVAINLIDDNEGNRILNVTKETEDSRIVFTGQIQQQ